MSRFGKPGLAEIAGTISGVYADDEPMILGGSLGLGLGNEKSDIDVLLVNPGPASRPAGPFQFFQAGQRIEVVRVELTRLRSMTGQLAGALAGGQLIGLPQADLRLLSRVAHGCRIGGPPLPDDFGTVLARTCHLAMIQRSAESARQHALVAVLAEEQDDDMVACWNARGAIEALAQRDLLASGVPYPGGKWLTEQLASSPGADAIRPLLRLPASGKRRAQLAESRAVVEASLGAPATVPGLGEHARWDTRGLRRHHLGASDVLVHPAHNAVTELTAGEGLAWDELATQPERPVGGETRPARDLAWRLYVHGLAGLRWTCGGGR